MATEILVVDNHPLVREYLSQLLAGEGYTVLTAEDGLAAVDILREHRPRVMFVDLIMPNIDGQTLCRIVRSRPEHREAFLVVLSATAAEMAVPIEACQANAYIAKGPFKKMSGHILAVLEEAQKSGFTYRSDEVRGLEDIHAREITSELLSLKHHFEVVLASMNEGIIEINVQGRIVYANVAALDITGRREEQLLSARLVDFFDEPDRRRLASHLQGVLESSGASATAGVPGIEVRLAERQLELRVYPIREDGRKAIVLLMDTTERKRFEDQLRRAQRLESIGTLAAGVAHDFNNLLTVIQGNADIIAMDLQPTHPHYERLEEILRQVQSAKRLTGQLLGYSRKGRFEVRLLDLNQLIRETVEAFGRTRKEISIEIRHDPELDLFEGDAGQIEQMILNLLLNAGDAMPGGGKLEIEIRNVGYEEISSEIFTPRQGRYLRISVHDTGTGMDAETRERIFEPFFTTKEMGRGTGLGLASVYGTVKGHGGYIEVDSEIGKGSTFTIYLPVTRRTAKWSGGSGKEPAESQQARVSRGTVLLIDDEQSVRKVAADILDKLHFETIATGTGEEALAIYREKRQEISLVILDVVMPGMGGSEVFKKLRSLDPAVKVLVCSGYSIRGEADRLLGLEANGFIQKPFSLEGLAASIDEILGPEG